MDPTARKNEAKLAELFCKYQTEDLWKRELMAIAIGFTKICDGRHGGFVLQGPDGTWAEQVDRDMPLYERMFNDLERASK